MKRTQAARERHPIAGKTEATGPQNSLVDVDNPDDIPWEGGASVHTPPSSRKGDDAYVTVDNPDDFE